MFFKVGVFDTPAQVFSCEICEIFKNRFFTEHLQWLLLTMLSVRKLLQQFVFLFTLLSQYDLTDGIRTSPILK